MIVTLRRSTKFDFATGDLTESGFSPKVRTMLDLRSGKEEGLPYSLSRWTDVPHAKWAWFLESLEKGWMIAFDQRTAVPSYWSLKPEDTLGLVWWTKNPRNLHGYADELNQYKNQVHVTITGWHEVEKGVPDWMTVAVNTRRLARRLNKESEVIWRFSPVPLLPHDEVVRRFRAIAAEFEGTVPSVYISFLQENDRIPETRTKEERIALMHDMAKVAEDFGIKVLLCNEDRTLLDVESFPNLGSGVCAAPEFWTLPSREKPPSEGCGCVMMIDPFTLNESCSLGCQYCYAADISTAPKKRNTTTKRSLQVVG